MGVCFGPKATAYAVQARCLCSHNRYALPPLICMQKHQWQRTCGHQSTSRLISKASAHCTSVSRHVSASGTSHALRVTTTLFVTRTEPFVSATVYLPFASDLPGHIISFLPTSNKHDNCFLVRVLFSLNVSWLNLFYNPTASQWSPLPAGRSFGVRPRLARSPSAHS